MSWTVARVKPYQSYNRLVSPRAWDGRNLVLVPPEVWKLGRADRRQIRTMLREAKSPEAVSLAIARVMELAAKVGRPLPIVAPAKPALTREQVLAFYQRQAAMKPAAPAPTETPRSDRPLSEGGGYASSGHSGEPPPHPPPTEAELLEPGASGRPRWMEREGESQARRQDEKRARVDRTVRSFEEWAKRMAEKAKERGRGD